MKNILIRDVQKDKKGLFFFYGGARVRPTEKTKIKQGDKIETIKKPETKTCYYTHAYAVIKGQENYFEIILCNQIAIQEKWQAKYQKNN